MLPSLLSLLQSRWSALWLFAALALVYVVTIAPSEVSIDVVQNATLAQTLATTGTQHIDIVDFRLPPETSPFRIGTPDGHETLNRTPGQVWLATPVYWLLAGDARAVSIAAGGVAAALMSAAGVALLFQGLRAVASLRLALLGTFVAGLTTPIWSVAADALWTHPVSVLGLGLVVWASATDRGWLVGLGYALAMTGRPHLALVAAAHGAWLAWWGRDWRPLVRIGVPALAATQLISAWKYSIFGIWSVDTYNRGLDHIVPGVNQHASWASSLAGFLVAPSRGLLVWTPVLLVMLVPVVRHWRNRSPWVVGLALGGVLYVIAQTATQVTFGGSAFYGYRYGIEPLLCWLPIVVLSLKDASPRVRWLFAAAVGYQLAVITIGAVGTGATKDAVYLGSHEDNIGWLPNSAWTLVAAHPVTMLPLVAGLVWVGWVMTRRLYPDRMGT